MVAHVARSLLVKLLDMKMWDGFLKITISVIWSGQRENLLSFATASGFSGSTEFSCMAGNHDQKRILNLPPNERNWILIVFVIADEPSTIPSLPTSFVAAIFLPFQVKLPHHTQRNHLGCAVRQCQFVAIGRSRSVAVICFVSNHDDDKLWPSNASS